MIEKASKGEDGGKLGDISRLDPRPLEAQAYYHDFLIMQMIIIIIYINLIFFLYFFVKNCFFIDQAHQTKLFNRESLS